MGIIAQAASGRRDSESTAPLGRVPGRRRIPCDRFRGFAVIVVTAVSLMSWAPLSAQEPPIAPEGTFVRITLDGGVSPFQGVRYDLTVRGRTVIVTLVKESLCYRGQQERLRLVDGDEARALVGALRDLGAFGGQIGRASCRERV